MTKKRQYGNTAISLAPLTVDEALGALLKTPPPPADLDKQAEAKKAAASARKPRGKSGRE